MKTEFSKPLKFKKSHFASDDRAWLVPNRVRPVAFSTITDAESIKQLNIEFGGYKAILKAVENRELMLRQEEIELIQIMLSYGIEK